MFYAIQFFRHIIRVCLLIVVINILSANFYGEAYSEQANDNPIDNEYLARGIESIVSGDSTEYAFFVCYPTQKRDEYSYQSTQMRSASMIKVFIMGTAMEKIRDGDLSLNQIMTLNSSDKVGGAGILVGYQSGTELSLDTVMRYMIIYSDNTATNMMIDLLGFNEINAYMQRNGYNDSILQRKMMDFDAVNAGYENYTSVNDLGHFFLKLFYRNCVSPELDDIMLSYLEGQTDTECFPEALPGIMVCHKTGELGGLYNDGGIVYKPGKPFIIVGMTDNYSNRSIAISKLRQVVSFAANN